MVNEIQKDLYKHLDELKENLTDEWAQLEFK
jgi:hypothetical protein